ncbi:MAG TPA: ABC transporter permease [Gammaproteobacteria bacterium]|nr:ABC transporter permease [Gammaproteobacteria bacterium]
MNELRQALRRTLAQPALSFVMIAMLALGLGATTAMYSIYHEVLERPLPVAAPEQLVNLGAPGPKYGTTICNATGYCDQIFSYPMFRDLEARQTAFAGIAGHGLFQANLSYRGAATPGLGTLVSGAYFSVLGVRPALGRLIGPEDEPRVGESAVAVLDYAYWRDYLGADPGAIGQTLSVNSQPLTIVGVAPESFFGTTWGVHFKVYVPLTMRWLMQPTYRRDDDTRTAYWVYAFARLGSGGSMERAAASINALYSGILNEVEVALNSDMPPDMLEQFRRRTITLAPGALGQSFLRDQSTPLTLLLGITALVLLIACANIANLLLARGVARSGEMALRASLGASRGRLVGQLLSAAFAALATVLAAVGLYGVLAYNVAQRTREIGLKLALGATPRQVRTMVVRQVGAMAVVGMAVGLVVAIAAGRGAGSLLYGLSGYDPGVLAAAVAVLGAVVAAAAYLPARRAARVAPMEALRHE